MRVIIATVSLAVVLALAQAMPPLFTPVKYNPNIKDLNRYRHPTSFSDHKRHGRDVSVDPNGDKISVIYPAGGGQIFGLIRENEGRFGYRANVFDNARGKLDASAYHSHSLGPASASNAGGRLDWHDSHAKASLDIARDLHGGPTNLNAAGGGTWPLGKNWDASAQGTYSQSLGHGRPDVGVLASINGRF